MKSYAKSISLKETSYNNFILFGVLFLVFGTFTLNTFFSTPIVKVIYLALVSLLLILYYVINRADIHVYKYELMWFVFIFYFLFNIALHNTYSIPVLIDLLVFFMIFIMLTLMKLKVDYYFIAMRLIIIMSFFHIIGLLLQYNSIDLYARIFLPLFTLNEQEDILKLYAHGEGTYTGFTWQTAFVAGFLVYGIGALIFLFRTQKKMSSKILALIVLVLLVIGLFLTGKRGHLIFLLLSLLVTFLFSTEIKKFLTQFFKVLLASMSFLLVMIGLIVLINPTKDTPIIGMAYHRISFTIEKMMLGEDITSGRTDLYAFAIELFNKAPVFGIGWREYSSLSAWIFNNEFGSHPHNIYIQLLTELGIFGLILFLIPIIYILQKTIVLLMNSEIIFNGDRRWKAVLQFALFSQLFFLFYGLTGNTLTDHMFLIMWGFASTITLSATKQLNKLKTISH